MVACKAALPGATSSLKQYEVTKQETNCKATRNICGFMEV